jgi:SAM-dependent methyltransferase/tetratricopeptide (TPR) repeat protein
VKSPQTPSAYVTQIRSYRAGRKFEEAEALCHTALQKFPSKLSLLIEDAENHRSRSRWNDAAKAWREIYSIHKEMMNAGSFLRMIQVLRRIRKLEEALTILREGLTFHPDEASLHIEHAELLTYLRRWKSASAAWRTVLARFPEKAPKNANIKHGWAMRHQSGGDDNLLYPTIRRSFNIGKEEYMLSFTPVFIEKKPSQFLCHRYLQDENVVMALGNERHSVFISKDIGLTYTDILKVDHTLFKHGFITNDLCLLLWRSDKLLELYDQQGMLLSSSVMPLPWHGSSGIGQSGSVIMFGEYTAKATLLHIRRSVDGGRSWSIALTVRGTEAIDPEIRHFHIVQPDPYYPGHWYASSGDQARHCRIWLSKDDGVTWKEVTDPSPLGGGIRTQSIHRFTALYFSPDAIYWPTDDTCGTTVSHWVCAKRSEPLQVKSIGLLGSEMARSLVVFPEGYLVFSEAKQSPDYAAQLHFISHGNKISSITHFPTLDNGCTSFTTSRSSPLAKEGRFFVYDYAGRIFCGGTEMYLGHLNRSRDLKLSDKCNICSEELHVMAVSGEAERIASLTDREQWNYLRQNRWEATCPSCDSHIRVRTLRTVIEEIFPGDDHPRSVLAVSAGNTEWAILVRKFQTHRNVSLYAPEVHQHCEIGVDITNMPMVESGRYDCVLASCVFDYIEDTAAAMGEIARVLRPGGVFLMFIMAQRLREDGDPPVFINNNALAQTARYFRGRTDVTGIPNFTFGIDWLAAQLRHHGFDVEIRREKDIFSGTAFPWFIGRKQEKER